MDPEKLENLKRCKDCPLMKTDVMTSYDSRGLIDFSYCSSDFTRGKLVDPDALRECDIIPKIEEVEVEENAA